MDGFLSSDLKALVQSFGFGPGQTQLGVGVIRRGTLQVGHRAGVYGTVRERKRFSDFSYDFITRKENVQTMAEKYNLQEIKTQFKNVI